LLERDPTAVVMLRLFQLAVPRLLQEAALLPIKLLRVALLPLLLLVVVSAALTLLPVLRDARVTLRNRLLRLWLGANFLTLPLITIWATVTAVLLVLPGRGSTILFRSRWLSKFRRRTNFLALWPGPIFATIAASVLLVRRGLILKLRARLVWRRLLRAGRLASLVLARPI
jgi:hypothetical protein